MKRLLICTLAGFILISLVLTVYIFWSIGLDGSVTLTEPDKSILYTKMILSPLVLMGYLAALVIIGGLIWKD